MVDSLSDRSRIIVVLNSKNKEIKDYKINNLTNMKEFKTNDFYQSCILKTLQFPLLRLEKNTERFVTFVFEDPENKAEDTINKYWNREITVVARDLIETINELRTRIHERMNK